MKIKKIGIVGCGVMGSEIARCIIRDFSYSAKLSALYDVDKAKAQILAVNLRKKNIVCLSLEDLMKKADLVIEAASAKASAQIARQALRQGKDCLVMSVGGLLSAQGISALAKRKGCLLHIPSGAICGIDGIKAHKVAGIQKVTLTTRKPPQALRDAPYVLENKINLNALKGESLIFEGTAQQAVTAFPQNINVAATLSLAGIGKAKTKVKIISSPEYHGNTHEIEVESKAGRTFIRCENNPSPHNPKTSFLAIASAVAVLRQIFDPVRVGT